MYCNRYDMQPIHGTEVVNLIDRRYKECNLPVMPSGQIMNPTENYMAVIICIGIIIDD